jgi:hypothetical protein
MQQSIVYFSGIYWRKIKREDKDDDYLLNCDPSLPNYFISSIRNNFAISLGERSSLISNCSNDCGSTA